MTNSLAIMENVKPKDIYDTKLEVAGGVSLTVR